MAPIAKASILKVLRVLLSIGRCTATILVPMAQLFKAKPLSQLNAKLALRCFSAVHGRSYRCWLNDVVERVVVEMAQPKSETARTHRRAVPVGALLPPHELPKIDFLRLVLVEDEGSFHNSNIHLLPTSPMINPARVW